MHAQTLDARCKLAWFSMSCMSNTCCWCSWKVTGSRQQI